MHLFCERASDYERKAIELAHEADRQSVRAARGYLNRLKSEGQLFNTEVFARDFEHKLIGLMKHKDASQKPMTMPRNPQ